MKINRKDFLMRSSFITAGISTGTGALIRAEEPASGKLVNNVSNGKTDKKEFKINVFSKPLQWLPVPGMVKLAAEAGFDGVDLTIRSNGHVQPENVETDLPKAVETANKAGITITMLTTSINNANDPLTEKVLKTAGALGIRHYRMDWLYYDANKSISDNLMLIQARMGKLAELNEKYNIHGEYQNHSGKYTPDNYFGSSIWDLYTVLKNINSPWLGSQFDIMHATVEGAYSWETDFKILQPYINSLAVKDFHWSLKSGKWIPQVVPLGDGMVDLARFFRLIHQTGLKCPMTLHFEYPLGGAETGAKATILREEDFLTIIRKDVIMLRKYLNESSE